MVIPEDFRFSDNPDVNIFAEARAKMLFGDEWKNRDDLLTPSRSDGMVRVSDYKLSGWVLLVETSHSLVSARLSRYIVSCVKNGEMEDPVENIAAVSGFRADGTLSYQAHYCESKDVNPPDGTPANVNYETDGSIASSWYVNAAGSLLSTTKEEIDRRVSAVKHRAAATLCAGGQDVIALSPGNMRPMSSPPHSLSL